MGLMSVRKSRMLFFLLQRLGEIGETFRRISWCSGMIVVKCWTVWDNFLCMFVFFGGEVYFAKAP